MNAAGVARTLVSAAPRLVSALLFAWRDITREKRRHECRPGRHKCPRHVGMPDPLVHARWGRRFRLPSAVRR
jgi:hypothetical protein